MSPLTDRTRNPELCTSAETRCTAGRSRTYGTWSHTPGSAPRSISANPSSPITDSAAGNARWRKVIVEQPSRSLMLMS